MAAFLAYYCSFPYLALLPEGQVGALARWIERSHERLFCTIHAPLSELVYTHLERDAANTEQEVQNATQVASAGEQLLDRTQTRHDKIETR